MSTQPRALAIIPARSGSRRIPDKNIRPFLGHPLMAYTIIAARRAGLFEHVVVSTDSELYGRIAAHYGATPLMRPAEHALDSANLVGTTLNAVEMTYGKDDWPEYLCVLMPVCPMRRADTIRAHFQTLQHLDRSFQLSVTEYQFVHAQWAMDRSEEGVIHFHWGREHLKRSQDLKPLVCPSGAIWWVRTRDFAEQQTFYGEPVHGELIPFIEGIDIDLEEDFVLAETLALGYERRQGTHVLEEPDVEPFGR